MPTYYEFFAGGGMVRAGLGPGWRCLFANDFDHKKCASYRANWGGGELVAADVKTLSAQGVPGRANLAWASFPCQDLSLAGTGAGLRGERSGTFWPFWSLMEHLAAEGRQPDIIALENVCGAVTAHGGKDFTAICEAFAGLGYVFGAMVIDARLFTPQSRPRLFIVGVHEELAIPESLTQEEPSPLWHTPALRKAQVALPRALQRRWRWWRLPAPPGRTQDLVDILEPDSPEMTWHDPAETRRLIALMSEANLAKIDAAKQSGRHMVGGAYRRTRQRRTGGKTQRVEARFDGLAGCLRTPAGGSSRQIVFFVDGENVRSRLLTSRETARLMGLPEDYTLPERYNEAYHLTGDGVAVPAVRHLCRSLFEPIAAYAVIHPQKNEKTRCVWKNQTDSGERYCRG